MEDAAARLQFASLLGIPAAQLMYPLMFPAAGAGCTFFRTPTSSPSPSPPASPGGGSRSPARQPTKSFTIDAILGLRKPTPYSRPTPLPALCSQQQLQQQQQRLPAPQRGAADGTGTGVGSKDKLGGARQRAGRPKRVRTIFTTEQLESMERAFRLQQYMVGKQRCQLAHTLNLHENQVKVWFQNRRIKWRRQNLEQEQARLAKISQSSQGSYDDSFSISATPTAEEALLRAHMAPSTAPVPPGGRTAPSGGPSNPALPNSLTASSGPTTAPVTSAATVNHAAPVNHAVSKNPAAPGDPAVAGNPAAVSLPSRVDSGAGRPPSYLGNFTES